MKKILWSFGMLAMLATGVYAASCCIEGAACCKPGASCCLTK